MCADLILSIACVHSCPSSFLKFLTPLFQLDPLFKRTYLLVVPVKAFGKVTSQNIFNILEICTTLARVLSEGKYSRYTSTEKVLRHLKLNSEIIQSAMKSKYIRPPVQS